MSLSQEDWEGLVAEWHGTGVSASRFAEEHGVPATALRYWINRLPTRAWYRRRRWARSRRRAAPCDPRRSRASYGLAKRRRVQRGGDVRVVVGKATVIVKPCFDDVHLRAVVRALSELG